VPSGEPVSERLRQPVAAVRLAPGLDASQPVDRQSRDDSNQEGTRVPHVAAIRRRPAQPRFLDHVLRIAHLPDDPIRHAEEDRSVLFEVGRRGRRRPLLGHGLLSVGKSVSTAG